MKKLSTLRPFLGKIWQPLIDVSRAFMVLSRDSSMSSIRSSDFVKLYEESFVVNPGFGKLFLNSHCNCIIRPASMQEHPNLNHAAIIYWGRKNKDEPKNFNIEAELFEKDSLKLEIFPSIPETFCEICIPIKYDVEADMESGADLEVEKLEGEEITLKTDHGSITTRNVKGKEISITTDSGGITTHEVLQGSIYINARKTLLKVQRFQGPELHVQVGELEAEVMSSYMDNGTIYADRGDINLKNLHGSTNVHLQAGKLVINGLYGCVRAMVNEGEVDIQINKVTEKSLIEINKGELHVSFTDVSEKGFDISSPVLDVAADIRPYGSFQIKDDGRATFKSKLEWSSLPCLYAFVHSGKARMSIKDWFSSLGIKTTTRGM